MASPTTRKERPFGALMAAEPPRKALAAETLTKALAHEATAKRPRGRPPFGAVWENNRYALPPESVELAAQKLEQHRQACRDRYKATREALRIAKP